MLEKENRMLKIITIVLTIFFVPNKAISQNIDKPNTIGTSIILSSQVINTDREIQIYLPENYDETSAKYPVLYVLDSQRYFLNGIAFQQNLRWQGMAPEFIIVGIVTNSQKRRNLFYDESTKFIQFLKKELIPKIDKDYRTLDERIYFGWEMAAGLGVEIFSDLPSLFNGYLLSSPTHISTNRLASVKKMLENTPEQSITLYASLGVVENWATESMTSLDSIFQQHSHKNIQWNYNLSENDNHYTTPLVTFNEGLKLFFNDYGPLRFYTMKSFKDFGGMKALKAYYTKRGHKYQIPVDIHDDTKHYLLLQSSKELNFKVFDELIKEFDGKKFIERYYNHARWFDRYSTFYLENNNLTDAFEIIELGLLKFPNASILHSGMGNYHKANGALNKAVKWYNKAITLAELHDESELLEYKKNLASIKADSIKKQ